MLNIKLQNEEAMKKEREAPEKKKRESVFEKQKREFKEQLDPNKIAMHVALEAG